MPILNANFIRWAEFESKINQISVDLCLSSLIQTPPHSPCCLLSCLPTMHIIRQVPLLSFEGCGPNQLASTHLRSKGAPTAAPPLSKGMWASSCMHNRGRRNMRGDPGSGRPTQCILNVNHNKSCGLFSHFIILSIHPTYCPSTQCQHSEPPQDEESSPP